MSGTDLPGAGADGLPDYDRLADAYSAHRRAHPEVLKALLRCPGLAGEWRVLEAGCGTGNYIGAVVEAAGCGGWGLDLSEGMLERARVQAPMVKYLTGTVENMYFENGFFDFVFSVDVIHFVRKRREYFREAFRVLKPGGVLCTVTDSEAIIRAREPLARYFPESVEADLARYPKVEELKGLMGEAGFGRMGEETVHWEEPVTDIGIWRERTVSSLHLITDDAFARGIARMEEDLGKGPIRWVSPYLLLWAFK